MRILGVDYGTKRMGIAVSDELGVIALPLEYIPSEPFPAFLDRFQEILETKGVELIIVGMPRNMDGSYGPAAANVEAFVAALRRALAIPVKTWDERLTTREANRVLIEAGVRRAQRKETVDKMAAAILLQCYLDSLI